MRDNEANNLLSALAEALNRDTLTHLKVQAAPLISAQQLDLISLDSGVNAQGLAVWINRQK